MVIKWSNIVALVLLLGAAALAIKHGGQIGAFLVTMQNIGPGHSVEEQTIGLIAFGLILVGILAAVKLFQNHNDKREQ